MVHSKYIHCQGILTTGCATTGISTVPRSPRSHTLSRPLHISRSSFKPASCMSETLCSMLSTRRARAKGRGPPSISSSSRCKVPSVSIASPSAIGVLDPSPFVVRYNRGTPMTSPLVVCRAITGEGRHPVAFDDRCTRVVVPNVGYGGSWSNVDDAGSIGSGGADVGLWTPSRQILPSLPWLVPGSTTLTWGYWWSARQWTGSFLSFGVAIAVRRLLSSS